MNGLVTFVPLIQTLALNNEKAHFEQVHHSPRTARRFRSDYSRQRVGLQVGASQRANRAFHRSGTSQCWRAFSVTGR